MNKETRCFVLSMAQVSCQKPLCDEWIDNPCRYTDYFVRAQEPDTRNLIPPSEARRMSRILKRALVTSITALNESGISHPEAIITGTGTGCMENSEKFLIDLCRYGENCLKPTLFMQSTHNTISSLIAIILKCHGYNNTYSHMGISFESALLDAWLQIKSGMIRNALIGAHDEVTPFMALVMERTHPEFAFISETSMSAMLSSGSDSTSACEIKDIKLFHKPDMEKLAALLNEDTDPMLMLGINGNPLNDAPYLELLENLDYSPSTEQYKKTFGDNFSSSAMAFYKGVRILESCGDDKTGRITLINHSEGSDWSIIRLQRLPGEIVKK